MAFEHSGDDIHIETPEPASSSPQDYQIVYNRVHSRLNDLRRRREHLPANLVRLEKQFMIECISLSQGR